MMQNGKEVFDAQKTDRPEGRRAVGRGEGGFEKDRHVGSAAGSSLPLSAPLLS